MIVKYKDLSVWLKLAVVMSWVIGVFYSIAFLIGFILELAVI